MSPVQPVTLEQTFTDAVANRLPHGAAQTVRETAAQYIERATHLDGRAKALQLYGLAQRAWTQWAAAAVRAAGLTDLANVIQQQAIIDDHSAAVAVALAPDYARQLASCPQDPRPGWEELRANAIATVEAARSLLAILAEQPAGLGETDEETFTQAVRDAAAALLAVWRMGVVELPREVRLVMANTDTATVKLAY